MYCKDSGHYLKELIDQRANNSGTKMDHKIVAVDVKGLYPNLSRNLIKVAVTESLQEHTDIGDFERNQLLELVLYCLDNNIVQFQNKFYKQKTGIATGDNNSVSIANIALHFIISKIEEIKKYSKLFKRFIDDIIYIVEDDNNSEIIQQRLEQEFKKYDLELTTRTMTTRDKFGKVEFLDVLHESKESAKGKFITTNYTKPTAIRSTFLNGKSYHPNSIFRGIIIGEAKRLIKLNEEKQGYEKV